MAASLALARTLPRHDRLRKQLRTAIELSFPLFTYKELKRMVRAQYHTFIMELRDSRTWDDISMLTGMTRAGLNKLGDVVPPKADANSVRSVLFLLHEAGESGLRLGELAAAFYERNDLDGPDLRDAVQALIDCGHVAETDGRYRAVDDTFHMYYDRERIESVVASVHGIAERVVESGGTGNEGLTRLSFRVPAQSVDTFYDRVRDALLVTVDELECAEGDATVTVVLAAGAELY